MGRWTATAEVCCAVPRHRGSMDSPLARRDGKESSRVSRHGSPAAPVACSSTATDVEGLIERVTVCRGARNLPFAHLLAGRPWLLSPDQQPVPPGGGWLLGKGEGRKSPIGRVVPGTTPTVRNRVRPFGGDLHPALAPHPLPESKAVLEPVFRAHMGRSPDFPPPPQAWSPQPTQPVGGRSYRFTPHQHRHPRSEMRHYYPIIELI
jgi:hypothetical protein